MSKTVRENHNICCPKCGSDDQIDVCANVWVRLCANGTDVFGSENGDQEWDDDSPCSCHVCDYYGPVGSFTSSEDFEEFVADYITCALWSSTDEADPETGGEPMDDNYGPEDIAPEALERIRADCAKFYTNYTAYLDKFGSPGYMGNAGHDFWLTRNGHGAGFWDGNWPEPIATFLSNASKSVGGFDLYVGDDGKIYGDLA